MRQFAYSDGETLNGDITAKSVTIDGVMVGTVKADTVQLAKHVDFNVNYAGAV